MEQRNQHIKPTIIIVIVFTVLIAAISLFIIPLADTAIQQWIIWGVNIPVGIIGVLSSIITITGFTMNDLVSKINSIQLKKSLFSIIEEFMDKPTYISSKYKNQLILPNKFIENNEGTILLFVYIPEMGTKLRDAPDNRYLFGHETPSENMNRFSLRYSYLNEWIFEISNINGENYELIIGDGLSVGYHHFMLAWNRSIPELYFFIDGGKWREYSISFAAYWPNKFDDTISFGAWSTPYETSYCETYLYKLQVFSKCYGITDKVVKEHIKSNPDLKLI